MKKLNQVLPFLLICIVASVNPIFAQEEMSGQLYSIHEDAVIPAKVQKYEEAAKNLATLFQQNNIGSVSFMAANSMDFTYIYIAPINSLADIEKIDASFGELQEKIGEKAFTNSMAMFDDCYDSHRDYLIRLRRDLSYNPDYGNDLKDGMTFRSWEFYHVYPGKEARMEELARKWQALYSKHNIPEGYRVYMAEMGTDMPLLIVAQSAVDAVDYYTTMDRIRKTLGEEGEALWAETMSLIRKMEYKTGMMRPDLSYLQPQVATANNPGDEE